MCVQPNCTVYAKCLEKEARIWYMTVCSVNAGFHRQPLFIDCTAKLQGYPIKTDKSVALVGHPAVGSFISG